jgi:hypothetical protein
MRNIATTYVHWGAERTNLLVIPSNYWKAGMDRRMILVSVQWIGPSKLSGCHIWTKMKSVHLAGKTDWLSSKRLDRHEKSTAVFFSRKDRVFTVALMPLHAAAAKPKPSM